MRKLAVILISFFTFWNFSCGIQNAPRAPQNSLPYGVEGLVIVSGNSQADAVNAQLVDPLTVAAFDKNGQPMVGAQVEFALESGAVELFTPTSNTAKDGTASTVVRLGLSAGASKVRATLLPNPSNDKFHTVYFDLNALREEPTKFKVTQGTIDSVICAEDPWVVKLTDQFGNAVPNTTVTVRPDGLQINKSSSPLDLLTGSDGVVTFKVNAPKTPGSGTLTLEGPGSVSGKLTINFAENMQWTSNRANPYILQEGDAGSFTMTLRNGCGPLAFHDYSMKYGQDPQQSEIPNPDNPYGKTASDGTVPIGVSGHSGGTYYYYGFLAVEDGESVYFRQTVHWLPSAK